MALINAHINCVKGMYVNQVKQHKDYISVFSLDVPDHYWNYCILRTPEYNMEEIEIEFRKNNRDLVIYTDNEILIEELKKKRF